MKWTLMVGLSDISDTGLVEDLPMMKDKLKDGKKSYVGSEVN